MSSQMKVVLAVLVSWKSKGKSVHTVALFLSFHWHIHTGDVSSPKHHLCGCANKMHVKGATVCKLSFWFSVIFWSSTGFNISGCAWLLCVVSPCVLPSSWFFDICFAAGKTLLQHLSLGFVLSTLPLDFCGSYQTIPKLINVIFA